MKAASLSLQQIQQLPAAERGDHLRYDLKFTKTLPKKERNKRAAFDRKHNAKTLFTNIGNVFKFLVGAASTPGQRPYAHQYRAENRAAYGVAGTYSGYQKQINAEGTNTPYTQKISAKD